MDLGAKSYEFGFFSELRFVEILGLIQPTEAMWRCHSGSTAISRHFAEIP